MEAGYSLPQPLNAVFLVWTSGAPALELRDLFAQSGVTEESIREAVGHGWLRTLGNSAVIQRNTSDRVVVTRRGLATLLEALRPVYKDFADRFIAPNDPIRDQARRLAGMTRAPGGATWGDVLERAVSQRCLTGEWAPRGLRLPKLHDPGALHTAILPEPQARLGFANTPLDYWSPPCAPGSTAEIPRYSLLVLKRPGDNKSFQGWRIDQTIPCVPPGRKETHQLSRLLRFLYSDDETDASVIPDKAFDSIEHFGVAGVRDTATARMVGFQESGEHAPLAAAIFRALNLPLDPNTLVIATPAVPGDDSVDPGPLWWLFRGCYVALGVGLSDTTTAPSRPGSPLIIGVVGDPKPSGWVAVPGLVYGYSLVQRIHHKVHAGFLPVAAGTVDGIDEIDRQIATLLTQRIQVEQPGAKTLLLSKHPSQDGVVRTMLGNVPDVLNFQGHPGLKHPLSRAYLVSAAQVFVENSARADSMPSTVDAGINVEAVTKKILAKVLAGDSRAGPSMKRGASYVGITTLAGYDAWAWLRALWTGTSCGGTTKYVVQQGKPDRVLDTFLSVLLHQTMTTPLQAPANYTAAVEADLVALGAQAEVAAVAARTEAVQNHAANPPQAVPVDPPVGLQPEHTEPERGDVRHGDGPAAKPEHVTPPEKYLITLDQKNPMMRRFVKWLDDGGLLDRLRKGCGVNLTQPNYHALNIEWVVTPHMEAWGVRPFQHPYLSVSYTYVQNGDLMRDIEAILGRAAGSGEFTKFTFDYIGGRAQDPEQVYASWARRGGNELLTTLFGPEGIPAVWDLKSDRVKVRWWSSGFDDAECKGDEDVEDADNLSGTDPEEQAVIDEFNNYEPESAPVVRVSTPTPSDEPSVDLTTLARYTKNPATKAVIDYLTTVKRLPQVEATLRGIMAILLWNASPVGYRSETAAPESLTIRTFRGGGYVPSDWRILDESAAELYEWGRQNRTVDLGDLTPFLSPEARRAPGHPPQPTAGDTSGGGRRWLKNGPVPADIPAACEVIAGLPGMRQEWAGALCYRPEFYYGTLSYLTALGETYRSLGIPTDLQTRSSALEDWVLRGPPAGLSGREQISPRALFSAAADFVWGFYSPDPTPWLETLSVLLDRGNTVAHRWAATLMGVAGVPIETTRSKFSHEHLNVVNAYIKWRTGMPAPIWWREIDAAQTVSGFYTHRTSETLDFWKANPRPLGDYLLRGLDKNPRPALGPNRAVYPELLPALRKSLMKPYQWDYPEVLWGTKGPKVTLPNIIGLAYLIQRGGEPQYVKSSPKNFYGIRVVSPGGHTSYYYTTKAEMPVLEWLAANKHLWTLPAGGFDYEQPDSYMLWLKTGSAALADLAVPHFGPDYSYPEIPGDPVDKAPVKEATREAGQESSDLTWGNPDVAQLRHYVVDVVGIETPGSDEVYADPVLADVADDPSQHGGWINRTGVPVWPADLEDVNRQILAWRRESGTRQPWVLYLRVRYGGARDSEAYDKAKQEAHDDYADDRLYHLWGQGALLTIRYDEFGGPSPHDNGMTLLAHAEPEAHFSLDPLKGTVNADHEEAAFVIGAGRWLLPEDAKSDAARRAVEGLKGLGAPVGHYTVIPDWVGLGDAKPPYPPAPDKRAERVDKNLRDLGLF